MRTHIGSKVSLSLEDWAMARSNAPSTSPPSPPSLSPASVPASLAALLFVLPSICFIRWYASSTSTMLHRLALPSVDEPTEVCEYDRASEVRREGGFGNVDLSRRGEAEDEGECECEVEPERASSASMRAISRSISGTVRVVVVSPTGDGVGVGSLTMMREGEGLAIVGVDDCASFWTGERRGDGLDGGSRNGFRAVRGLIGGGIGVDATGNGLMSPSNGSSRVESVERRLSSFCSETETTLPCDECARPPRPAMSESSGELSAFRSC